MAISDTIQSMYENVGEVYDTITNVSLPEHKNIENIPSTIRDSYLEIMNNGIDVIWDNWEKVVGEGTELTLNNTEQAPMKVLLKWNTYQDSTTGANLQKYNERTDSSSGISYSCDSKGQVITSGTTTAGATFSYNLTNINPMSLSAGTYKLKVIGTLSSNTLILNQSNQTITLDSNQEAIITIDSDISNFGLKVRCNTGQNVNDFYITIASGTIATTERYTNGASPNPDYPQEVHVVSGDNEVEVVGQNVFDMNWLSGSNITIENGVAIGTGVNFYYAFGRNENFIPNTNYGNKQISISASAYNDSDGTSTSNGLVFQINYTDNTYDRLYFQNNNITKTTKTITSNNSKEIKNISLSYISGGSYVWHISEVMITYGDTPQPYEEYKKTTYPINLPEGMFLGSIGDYKDRFFKTIEGDSVYDSLDSATKETLDSNEWYLEKNIGKVEYDGSNDESWSYGDQSTQLVTRRFIATINDIKQGTNNQYPCLCNRFKQGPNNVDNFVFITTGNGKVWFGSTTLSSLDTSGFRTWLSTHTTILYYVLATPTYTKIEGTLASQLEALNGAKSYTGQTNISQTNDDLPFVLSVSALKEIN